ncbi:MAG: hypothetical protein IPH35_02570 [Rhodoferax sp.]|nr:hypothetical protein [Rhodoferax sp.]
MKPLERCSLQCIYCDDIRAEAQGKTTIVGWHTGEPIGLPAEGALLIPTLGIVGMLAMPLESKHESMKVELLQDQHVLQSVAMPEQALHEMQVDEALTLAPLFGYQVHQVRIAIKMNNLQVAQPCVLRMRVTVDDEEVYGNGLRFTR